MNKQLLIALAGTISVANAANAACTETDHSTCESTECCGVIEEEGFNFFEALEEYWGAHHEHEHICHTSTASEYTDSAGTKWGFHCDEMAGATYQLFAAAAVAYSALFTLL